MSSQRGIMANAPSVGGTSESSVRRLLLPRFFHYGLKGAGFNAPSPFSGARWPRVLKPVDPLRSSRCYCSGSVPPSAMLVDRPHRSGVGPKASALGATSSVDWGDFRGRLTLFRCSFLVGALCSLDARPAACHGSCLVCGAAVVARGRKWTGHAGRWPSSAPWQ